MQWRDVFRELVYRKSIIHNTVRWANMHAQLFYLSFYKDEEDVEILKQGYRKTQMLLQPQEGYMLHALAKMQACIPGDMAEVGVYYGGSARLICAAKGDCDFYGFDTFEGLPTVSGVDKHFGIKFLREKQFRAQYETVKQYLAPYGRTHLIKGVFPASAGQIRGRTFSFVHLDIDLYEGTIASLRFFWDVLVDRGIIVVHDSHVEGVKKAISEFLEETPGGLGYSGVGSQYVFTKKAQGVGYVRVTCNPTPRRQLGQRGEEGSTEETHQREPFTG